MGPPLRSPFNLCTKLFFGPFSHMLHSDGLFFKCYQHHQIGTPPPSGRSHHHRLPLVLPYSSFILRGFPTCPTSHSDSFHSAIFRACLSSPNLLSKFRFGQTWSETKTLQIVLERFCIPSSAHASFYMS